MSDDGIPLSQLTLPTQVSVKATFTPKMKERGGHLPKVTLRLSYTEWIGLDKTPLCLCHKESPVD